MTTYQHLTHDEAAARWPRLIRAMKWAACLSTTEAGCALRDYRTGRAAAAGIVPYPPHHFNHQMIAHDSLIAWGHRLLKTGGGEAVCHFGGPARTICEAIRCRHVAQEIHRTARQEPTP